MCFTFFKLVCILLYRVNLINNTILLFLWHPVELLASESSMEQYECTWGCTLSCCYTALQLVAVILLKKCNNAPTKARMKPASQQTWSFKISPLQIIWKRKYIEHMQVSRSVLWVRKNVNITKSLHNIYL